jgi:intracellular sulfur oxidation DsrE/DsrF family protein
MPRSHRLLEAAVLMLAVCAGVARASQPDGFWITPTIVGFGHMHPLDNAAYRPKPDQVYKVVFAMSMGAKSPKEVNPSLDGVARAVNLYTQAGVPLKNLQFVAVAYAAATPLVLNDAQYKAAFGVPNPNLPLIKALRDKGIDVAVCGQAIAGYNYKYEWVDAHVTLSLSAITTITTLEHEGYGLLQL